MFASSLKPICLLLTLSISISIHPSNCHPHLSWRGLPSLSTLSHHRYARRSPQHSFKHVKRSSSDESNNSLDQQKYQADRMWEDFVEAMDEEDPLFYSDCDDIDEISDDSLAQAAPSKNYPSTQIPSNSVIPSESEKPITLPSRQTSKPQRNAPYTNPSKPTSTDDDPKAKEAAQKKEAELAAARKEAEAKKEHDEKEAAEAEKQKEEAEAEKQKDEAEAQKRKDEAEAQKRKDEAEAEAEKRKQEAEAARKADEHKDDYTVTNLNKIPGTPVTTGTAHHNKDTYNTSPSGTEHSGDATFFTPDTGACGHVNTSKDFIVAVSHILYDSFPSVGGNPNTNAVCGKRIRATFGGKSVTVTVADRCEACSEFSLDFTESAFLELGTLDQGRLKGMTWTFI